jgi:pyruvate,water dikinase
MASQRSFILPNEIPEIPGTDGWREMYPRHLVFSHDNAKQIEYESTRFWFLESLHAPAPLSPLDCYSHDMWRLTLSQSNNRIFMVPTARGIDHRIINGYIYISPVAVETAHQIEQRAELFNVRAGHYYQNWEEIFKRWHRRMEKIVTDMEAVQFGDLPDIEPEETVTGGRGYGASYPLIRDYNRFWDTVQLSWQYHFELLNLAYGAAAHYINTMRTIFPYMPDKALGKLIAGFDSQLFRPPEELQKLATLAVELKLGDAISGGTKWEEVKDKIGQSAAGLKWLKAFEAARYPWFEMSCGIGWYHDDATWNENLDFPLSQIRQYIEKLNAGESIARPREEVIAERDRYTAEYRTLIAHESDKETFDNILTLARMVAPYAEDHNWYCTNYEHSIFFRKMRSLGEIFVRHRFIEDKDDIFYFNRYELPEVLYDLCSGWAIGTPATGTYYWPGQIEKRKNIMEKFKTWQAPPALGPAPETVEDPFLTAFWGITTERLDSWLDANKMNPKEVSQLQGVPASSGVVEGIARVCKTVDDIKLLKTGEILVSANTSPNWATAFQTATACVTDIGGTCCHAAIVAREYGLSAVVGTGYATQIIKTGDRIRVDGNSGVVRILEKAP